MSEQPSHVFVVRANLVHLACDAWLLPTDARVDVTPTWRRALPDLDDRLARTDVGPLRDGRALAAELDSTPDEPSPILTVGPLAGFTSPDDLRPAVRAFLELGAAVARRKRAAGRGTAASRPVPLLALPFFGSRGGGGELTQGSLLATLLDEVEDAGPALGVDIVLAFADDAAYAWAQQLRRTSGNVWRGLSGPIRREAERLAAEARRGRLVPFMGAGVSVTAGGPSWPALIERLANAAQLDDEELTSLLRSGRDARDQAAFLRAAFLRSPRGDDPDGGFGAAIATIVDRPRYGLAPALLALLRAEQSITLNYDELFERAAEDAGLARSVIPGTGALGERWLLKLHGTVTDRSTIVLTRRDYLGFRGERAAYSAMVTATMMTRHLLFVGFGLADDHFHEIVHDVRRTAGGTVDAPLGTVLTLEDDPLEMTIWRDELLFVRPDPLGEDSARGSSRAIEIFLDAVLALATDRSPYLLADGFEDGLLADELALRGELLAFAERLDAGARGSPAWRTVERTLAELGLVAKPSD